MVKEFFTQIKNFFFCLRYPFWVARNEQTDKKIGNYKYTLYDSIPTGWRVAFGKQLSKDLKKQLIKDKNLFKFRFLDIKEKWGRLCLYVNDSSEELDNLLAYYELLSKCYCIHCGNPVRYVSKGYILYLCEDCIKEIYPKTYEECRLTEEDIPKIFRYNRERMIDEPVDLEIDLYKAWDIKRMEKENEKI